MLKPSITSSKLRSFAESLDRLDTIRQYWDDGEQQRCKPDKIIVHIPDGSSLKGNQLFSEELAKTILIEFDQLYYKTMKRLEKDVDDAGDSVGIKITDPLRKHS